MLHPKVKITPLLGCKTKISLRVKMITALVWLGLIIHASSIAEEVLATLFQISLYLLL